MLDSNENAVTPNKQADGILWESVSILLDNRAQMSFKGRQFAGGSWFDEETGTLTKQTLYITPENEQIYVITEMRGSVRHRRAYKVAVDSKEQCTIFDGRTEMTVPLRLLLYAVQRLVGLDGTAKIYEQLEETLHAANC